MTALELRAGPLARQHIEREGLVPDAVRVMAGAAGGPKWLALRHLDEHLFADWFAGRSRPLFTLGSSIGSWRFTAAAQPDPGAALARFEAAYLAQRYSDSPDATEISRVAAGLLDSILEDSGVDAVLDHPWLRPSIVTARCLGRAASEEPSQLKLGLARLALSNARGRPRLARHMERVLFHHPADPAPFRELADAFTSHHVPLTRDNLRPALMASAAVPMLMRGEPDIPAAPPGMYRDGGLIDYHFDLDWGLDDGLLLYPHFSTRIVPGWLDKFLPWRKPDPAHQARMLLVAPSAEFIASLPNGKIPDRKDFQRYNGDIEALLADWARATAECRRLADEFGEWVAAGTPADRLEPLPAPARSAGR